ncbi:MAG: cytochrome c oxidase assembly protein [Gemmatimonadales bacterium]
MTWWCSATGQTWSWAWKAYPGVWLFIALIGWWYWRVRRLDPPLNAGGGGSSERQEWLWFGTGLLCLWLSLDWPLGALGAGYLASAHTVSYILLSLVAPPCIILGIPVGTLRRAATLPRLGPALRLLAHPAFGLSLYVIVLLGTHLPGVVDSLMSTQVGALLVDLAWMLGGVALWWPPMAPSPEYGRFTRPLKMGYLFLSTIASIIPSAFLTFADYPLFATYELAPRVFTLMTAQQDQQVAGLLMKIVGDLPVWFAFGVVFFRWARESQATPPPMHPSSVRVAGRG